MINYKGGEGGRGEREGGKEVCVRGVGGRCERGGREGGSTRVSKVVIHDVTWIHGD